MRTERYDLAIPDMEDVKSALQKVCDEKEEYPIKISHNKNGYVVSFMRLSIPQFKYVGLMAEIINCLKLELSISTIVMQKRMGTISDETAKNLKKIRNIKEEDVSESKKEAAALSLKLTEDNEYFNSFAKKQILTSDYDTAMGRMADRQAIIALRHPKNPQKVEEPKAELFVVADAITGQFAFDLTKY